MEKFSPKSFETSAGKERESGAVVVSGFPGIGKTTLTNKHDDLVLLDSDSSDFSWSVQATRKRHPNWPQNYVDHIRTNRSNADIILVSTHKEVRDALVSAGIGFVLVYPSLQMKREYINRYRSRGSDSHFVTLLEANYEKWIEELMEQKMCRHVVFQPGQYLSDVIDGIRPAR